MLQLFIDTVAALAVWYFFGPAWAGAFIVLGIVCWLAGSFVKGQNRRIDELQKQVIGLTSQLTDGRSRG